MSVIKTPVHRYFAFTLIELLVVIALISLLMGILMVALSGARENARAMKCLSHLRQIGTATQAYITDNRNRLPYEDRGEEGTGFRCWVDVYADDGYLIRADADEASLRCPSVLVGQSNAIESYRINSKLSETTLGQPGYDPHRQLDTIPEQTRTVGFFDGDVGGSTVSFKGRWRDNDDDVAYRHNTSTVITFLDWHVERIDKKELSNRSVDNTDIIWQIPQLGTWNPSP